MLVPNYVLLYVDAPPASAAFYASLLGRAPVETSPTFALFVLESGLKIGLWSRHTVEPAAVGTGDRCELAFTLPDAPAVDALYASWRERGLPIAQTPTALDFGYSCVALDPDGHRLRAFAPARG